MHGVRPTTAEFLQTGHSIRASGFGSQPPLSASPAHNSPHPYGLNHEANFHTWRTD